MLAVWECPTGNQVPTGSYLDPTFSCGTPPTISLKRLRAFETRSIRTLKILRHITSCNLHQKKKHSKHLPGSNACGEKVRLDQGAGTSTPGGCAPRRSEISS